jgi:transposase
MDQTSQTPPTDLAVIGIDIGKEVFHLIGLSRDGKVVLRRKIRRLALTDIFKKLPPCLVGMEACLSAHFVSRTVRALGHEARIIPALYVKPFVKGQKNDYNDAEAVAEAALRPNLRSVREKTQDELDLQAYHRIRAAGLKAHRHHQPDPGLSDRAGHRRSRRCECLASVALPHPQEPRRRDFAAHG